MGITREEAIRIAQGLITNFKCESETMVEFCNVVIEALEQINVLDKIRAEIQFIKDKCLPNTIAEEYEQKGLQEALDIIDKVLVEENE